mmetsp:Transcript_72042/g.204515  ORF Transcript_72042/g.204515 Transcript_72042/m.204515 type:complete len:317 (+) Transcript_72042:461-1411(+)
MHPAYLPASASGLREEAFSGPSSTGLQYSRKLAARLQVGREARAARNRARRLAEACTARAPLLCPCAPGPRCAPPISSRNRPDAGTLLEHPQPVAGGHGKHARGQRGAAGQGSCEEVVAGDLRPLVYDSVVVVVPDREEEAALVANVGPAVAIDRWGTERRGHALAPVAEHQAGEHPCLFAPGRAPLVRRQLPCPLPGPGLRVEGNEPRLEPGCWEVPLLQVEHGRLEAGHEQGAKEGQAQGRARPPRAQERAGEHSREHPGREATDEHALQGRAGHVARCHHAGRRGARAKDADCGPRENGARQCSVLPEPLPVA